MFVWIYVFASGPHFLTCTFNFFYSVCLFAICITLRCMILIKHFYMVMVIKNSFCSQMVELQNFVHCKNIKFIQT